MKKVALVVGASSGFGLLVAQALLKTEFIVYAAARRTEPMAQLAKQGAKLLSMDVCSDTSVNDGINTLLNEQHRIDVVFNNAGYGAYGCVELVDTAEVMHQFNVNVFGVARINKAVLPSMRKQGSGRIIVTTSLASHLTTPGSGWYTATKHALKALCEAMRMELKPLGIKVIQIEPGPVKTGFEEVAFTQFEQLPEERDYQPLMSAFQRYMHETYRKAPGPKSTVEAMLKAATAHNPKAVYRTTMAAKVFAPLRQWLGSAVTEWLVMKIFNAHQAQTRV
ncbi:SDR family NAD(P)-dependent oxidoreductase [Gallaecimonas mangrovi]|uniref:SDR family NAD(P)-dependent oxidoreductase n=1 Tax=Gallaecimonas mangrovi TaxID=2291597 RepID=UPI000E20AAA6|nr:SDR family NAD(P)-dependent oxidoreductase [Gallaecimonas mangrovi]